MSQSWPPNFLTIPIMKVCVCVVSRLQVSENDRIIHEFGLELFPSPAHSKDLANSQYFLWAERKYCRNLGQLWSIWQMQQKCTFEGKNVVEKRLILATNCFWKDRRSFQLTCYENDWKPIKDNYNFFPILQF